MQDVDMVTVAIPNDQHKDVVNAALDAGKHVICEKPIMENVPLQRNGDDITTQYTGVELEHLGFLKMDFLFQQKETKVNLPLFQLNWFGHQKKTEIILQKTDQNLQKF